MFLFQSSTPKESPHTFSKQAHTDRQPTPRASPSRPTQKYWRSPWIPLSSSTIPTPGNFTIPWKMFTPVSLFLSENSDFAWLLKSRDIRQGQDIRYRVSKDVQDENCQTTLPTRGSTAIQYSKETGATQDLLLLSSKSLLRSYVEYS